MQRQWLGIFLILFMSKPAQSAEEILLKWYVDRWELNKEGQEQPREGRLQCSISSSQVKSVMSEAKLAELRHALGELYAARDKRVTSMLLRAVEPSRELVGLHKGEEFLIEKMFSTRESIQTQSPSPGKTLPKAEAAFELVKKIAGASAFCRH